MNVFHVVKVHFDRRKPEIDSQWIRDRVRFCWDHTVQSLHNQSQRDFVLWASCGVNMAKEDVDEVDRNLCMPFRMRAMVSWDDQHEPPKKLTNLVPKSCDYVYVTRIDSDDLYAPDALRLARECKPSVEGAVEASMFRRGYVHDLKTGETGTYHSPSTPFHTMMIPRHVFCDPELYRMLDYGDHSRVNACWKTHVLPDYKFTVLIHGKNFLSDMSYGRERIFGVEKDWSVQRFLDAPVTFDVDDFCDRWNCLPELDKLKEYYPDFRCTLFTIPYLTSIELLAKVNNREWIELALHGTHHDPNEELKAIPPENLKAVYEGFKRKNLGYVNGTRPPGWYITANHIKALNELGMWVAIHERDARTLGPLCEHGFYVCDDRPNWHGHTSGEGQRAHSVCGNGIAECLPELLRKWPRDQKFAKVSESIRTIR